MPALPGCAGGGNKNHARRGGPTSDPLTQEKVLARQEGAMTSHVISGSPRRDSIAYNAASERLSEADWQQLEQFGPRPIWEQLSQKQKNCKKNSNQRARRGSVIETRTTDEDPAEAPTTTPTRRTYDPAPTTQPSAAAPVAVAAAPSTQPTTQPSTQPTTQPLLASTFKPAPMPLPPEEDLPVEIVELPDGKLRMVWRLRSYGGTAVTSKLMDGNTTRRKVDTVAPDLTPLVTVLTQYLGQGGMVVPLPKENTLVILCPRESRASVLNLLDTLDVPPRQVEITAKIFEVSRDFDFQQGAELVLNKLASDSSASAISTFSAKRFLDSVGSGQPVQGSVLKLMQTFADAGISVDTSFQLLAESGMINVVSSPRMTVAVGQTGYMLAGQELPIQSANIVNNVLQTATTYKPVGVQLYVTPQAVGEKRVKLHTISIVSSVSGFTPLPTMEGHQNPKTLINPIIDSREAETAVTVDDGSTLVISGLRMVRMTTREAKIPGLGDLPIVGWMFKNHRTQQQQTDLYFFLTPTLL